jgi:His-Xaa-Ser repeat protein HxsA
MRAPKFIIPTLLAAGLVPATALASESPFIGAEKSLVDDIIDLAKSISEMNEFSLAGHRSHASHASHSSHTSHRSYLAPEPRVPGFPGPPLAEAGATVQTARLDSRNERSTPLSSILPSSPQNVKKPTILKGNTKKFAEIVTRVQLALATRGYEVGLVNGELHSRTIAALFKFQKLNGLIPTGKLENETLNNLNVIAN